jgi:hypothetical protein
MHPSSGKLLEEVVLLPGETETEARHQQGADIDHPVDLHETLAGAALSMPFRNSSNRPGAIDRSSPR